MHRSIDSLLDFFSQKNLLPTCSSNSWKQQQKLLKQLLSLQEKWAGAPCVTAQKEVAPLTECPKEEEKDWSLHAESILKDGKAAILLFSGGLGSRLGNALPKGLIPFADHTTLLSRFCHKVRQYENRYHSRYPFLLMLSKQTEGPIRRYLQKNDYFGLDIESFVQQSYPFYDLEGNWFLDEEGMIIELPNGNGDCFRALKETAFIQKKIWEKIEYIHCMNIDNFLTDPLSPSLMGYAKATSSEVTFKVFEKENPAKVGIATGRLPQVEINEYTSVTNVAKGYANIGHYCLHMAALKKVLDQNPFLPLHWVQKSHLDKIGYKAEKFFFDIFPYFATRRPLAYKENRSYLPVKNKNDLKNIQKRI